MIRPGLRALLWLALALSACAASAQERTASARDQTGTSQIGANEGGADTRISPPGGQVSPGGERGLDRNVQLTGRDQAHRPASQLTGRQDGFGATSQLTQERAPATPGAQLYRGEATAVAPTAISRPSQGRTAPAAGAIGGRDRCDSPMLDDATKAACLRVIETRSAEFERSDPLILSPEQRLLVDQRLREGPATVQSAAQRLARNDVDADASDTQGIASLTLPRNEPASARTETEQPIDAQLNAIVEAIVAGTNGGAPVVTPAGPR